MAAYTIYDIFTVLDKNPDITEQLRCELNLDIGAYEIAERLHAFGMLPDESVHQLAQRYIVAELRRLISASLESGKRYTWQEIKDAYPNSDVILTNIEEDDDGNIKYATVLGAVSEDAENKLRALDAEGIEYSIFCTEERAPTCHFISYQLIGGVPT